MSIIEEALRKAAKLQESEAAKRSSPVEPAAQILQPEAEPTATARANLVTLSAPFSPAAEEYRKLKEALVDHSESGDRFDNVFLVTSATPNEGKTLTSLNLSATLAQAFDHTVLVVDADLRRPSCHRYLGVETEKGLSNCLLKGVDISSVLIKTGIGKLVLLPAGSEQDNPSELFASNMMKDLITELKYRYKDRYIIIDTPPILLYAETRSLCGLADGVLLVVREDCVCTDEVTEAINTIGDKLLGVVYNAAFFGNKSKHYSHYNMG